MEANSAISSLALWQMSVFERHLAQLTKYVHGKGFSLVDITRDGSCQYASASHQLNYLGISGDSAATVKAAALAFLKFAPFEVAPSSKLVQTCALAGTLPLVSHNASVGIDLSRLPSGFHSRAIAPSN